MGVNCPSSQHNRINSNRSFSTIQFLVYDSLDQEQKGSKALLAIFMERTTSVYLVLSFSERAEINSFTDSIVMGIFSLEIKMVFAFSIHTNVQTLRSFLKSN